MLLHSFECACELSIWHVCIFFYFPCRTKFSRCVEKQKKQTKNAYVRKWPQPCVFLSFFLLFGWHPWTGKAFKVVTRPHSFQKSHCAWIILEIFHLLTLAKQIQFTSLRNPKCSVVSLFLALLCTLHVKTTKEKNQFSLWPHHIFLFLLFSGLLSSSAWWGMHWWYRLYSL